MKNNEKETLNIKDIIINICLKWRYILVVGIIFSAIFGLKQVVINMNSNQNEVEQQYQEDYKMYNEKLDSLKWRINKKSSDLENQIVYNENSIKMKINALDFSLGKLSYYIKTIEGNTPDSINESIKDKDKILDTYTEYFLNGSFYSDLVDGISVETEVKYMKEIVSVTFKSNDQIIDFTVIQENQALCKELIDLINELITKKRLELVADIGEHEVIKSNETIEPSVDFELKEFTESKIELIDSLNNEIEKLDINLNKVKSEAPVNVFETSYLIKHGIKSAIFAFIAAVMLMGVYYSTIELFTGKFNSISNFKSKFNIPVIGEFGKNRKSRIDKWILKLSNRINYNMVDTDRIQLIREIVQNIVSHDENPKGEHPISVYIIGSTRTNAFDSYGKKFEEATTTSNIKFVAGKDIFSDINTIKSISQYQYVIILEQFGVSKYEKIEEELELLKRLNKTVIGSIVIDI